MDGLQRPPSLPKSRITRLGVRTVRRRQIGKNYSQSSLETGILSRGLELELSLELQAPLRVPVQQEDGPKSGSWWKMTQIISREKHPQFGLLEDRLRYNSGLIKINKHRKRKRATAEFELR